MRENLSMLSRHGLSAQQHAELTQTHFMPLCVTLKTQISFSSLCPGISASRGLLSGRRGCCRHSSKEIQTRSVFEKKMVQLQAYLSALKLVQGQHTALLSYIVSAENRVANAKLKVDYAREQVAMLEAGVVELSEMSPEAAVRGAQQALRGGERAQDVVRRGTPRTTMPTPQCTRNKRCAPRSKTRPRVAHEPHCRIAQHASPI